MKRLLAGGLFLSALLTGAFAGDSAVLVDKGFSKDGNFYIFGQYGRTDKNFQGWAEIFSVDVAKNDFVQGGVFKTAPSSKTASLSGEIVYKELEKTASWNISKYQAEAASPDRILYIREEESKKANDEILFQDFTRSIGREQAFYSVKLVDEYSGKGASTKSSFFIMVEKKESSGRVIARQKVGSPYIKRSGVTGYKIERIVCDESGRNLVFIIEKQVEDSTGVNIRYMVEAARLSDDFSPKPFKPSYDKPVIDRGQPDWGRKNNSFRDDRDFRNYNGKKLPRLSVEESESSGVSKTETTSYSEDKSVKGDEEDYSSLPSIQVSGGSEESSFGGEESPEASEKTLAGSKERSAGSAETEESTLPETVSESVKEEKVYFDEK